MIRDGVAAAQDPTETLQRGYKDFTETWKRPDRDLTRTLWGAYRDLAKTSRTTSMTSSRSSKDLTRASNVQLRPRLPSQLFHNDLHKLLQSAFIKTFPDGSMNACISSPYGLDKLIRRLLEGPPKPLLICYDAAPNSQARSAGPMDAFIPGCCCGWCWFILCTETLQPMFMHTSLRPILVQIQPQEPVTVVLPDTAWHGRC